MKKALLSLVFCICVHCLWLSVAECEVSVRDFFQPEPDSGRELPAGELYPEGRLLAFTFFSPELSDLPKMKTDCFTAVGPFYEVGAECDNQTIEKARISGLKCLYTVGIDIDFVHDPNYVMPDVDEIRERITAQVAAVAKNKEIGWWYLMPEELRYWRPDEMQYIGAATKAIRAADPCGRPVWMYEPNHRNAAALAKTLRYQDICGKGMYCNCSGNRNSRIWCRWTVEQELAAIKAVRPKAIPVVVLEMVEDPEPKYMSMINAWTRHDAYLALVSGAKGMAIYSGIRREKISSTFDEYYKGYASVARELNGELGLSKVFLFGQERNDIKIDITSGPATLELDYDRKIHTYPSISHLDAAYEAERYLFMVNSADVPVDAVISGLPDAKVLRQDLFGDCTFVDTVEGTFKVSFEQFEVKCFRFVPVSRCSND